MNRLRPCLLAAFAATLALDAAAQEKIQDKVTFALNWIPSGNHFGVFAAKDRDLYRDANVDVDIQRGYGSGDTLKRVATGNGDIGIADAASVIIGRSKGMKVKQIASIFDTPFDCIFFLEGNGIAKPKDLEGRSLGASPGETTVNILPIFATNAGIDAKKISILNLSPSAKYASLAAKTVDAIVGSTVEEPAIQNAAQKTGSNVKRFRFSDYGVDYYSIGLIAGDDMLATRGDLVRRLVGATMQGYAWSIQHPEEAADAFTRSVPESSRDLMLAQWKIAVGHMVTERTRNNGLGWIEPARMAATLRLTKTYQDIDPAIRAEDLYSMDYLAKIPLN
jgi:NitT/TauT family transport system substrate-binding protein